MDVTASGKPDRVLSDRVSRTGRCWTAIVGREHRGVAFGRRRRAVAHCAIHGITGSVGGRKPMVEPMSGRRWIATDIDRSALASQMGCLSCPIGG